MSRAPLILYELNEVPWRVFDWYAQHRPRSAIATLLAESACYTTRTRDEGELHPWSTWPTLHRGVCNAQHGIFFINQDRRCAAAYPPLWETLAQHGVRVGVFGSLQSYPAPAASASLPYCFYIPDTFAPSPETLPPAYRAFQAINLRQTRADGAVAGPLRVDGSLLRDIARLPFIGIRASTFAMLARQLLSERLNPAYRSRRAILQAPLAFDVFLHAHRRHRPQFCTFFTNHVAGAMHRCWKAAFPQDFGGQPGGEDDSFKRDTLLFAMDVADAQLRELKQLSDDSGGVLVVATSMGQQAIERGAYVGELRLTEPTRMMQALGFNRPWKDRLAMQPDFNFEFDSSADAESFIRQARRLRAPSGDSLWQRIRQQGASVNLGMARPVDVIAEGTVLLDALGTGQAPARRSLAELGISVIQRDPGTGYHQPLGALIWYGGGARSGGQRSEIESTQVRDMILDAFGVDAAPAPATLKAGAKATAPTAPLQA